MHQVRVIVGGSNLATHYGELRAVVVEVDDVDNCRAAAEHEVHHVRNFYSHQVYLTEHDGHPHFHALWTALTDDPAIDDEDLADSSTIIGPNTAITTEQDAVHVLTPTEMAWLEILRG